MPPTAAWSNFLNEVGGRAELVVVFNNDALGFIELEQKSTCFPPVGTELRNPNFAAMAKAAGVRGLRQEVRYPGAFCRVHVVGVPIHRPTSPDSYAGGTRIVRARDDLCDVSDIST